MVRYTGKKYSQSLSANIERRSNRNPPVTRMKREDELRDERIKKIERLDSKAHLMKGKKAQKIEEECAYSIDLEAYGFNKRGG